MGDAAVQLREPFSQKALQIGSRTLLHERLDLADGKVQFAQQQDGFQQGALMVVIIAVPIFRVDRRRPEQADLIIPHQGFFVDPMQGRKLADGKQSAFFIHFSIPPLTVQLLYRL